MKTESKLFDRIRVQPRHAAKPRPEVKICDWEGCDKSATHRAPKGARSDGEHHNFCLEHVRKYNQSFDFHAAEKRERDAGNRPSTEDNGEKPTWAFGTNKNSRSTPRPHQKRAKDHANRSFSDPLHIFARYDRVNNTKSQPRQRERTLVEADKRALETLGFDHRADATELKRAYKDLVKKHHPDANGGDRASEDRLRSVISAYTHLKTKGFV